MKYYLFKELEKRNKLKRYISIIHLVLLLIATVIRAMLKLYQQLLYFYIKATGNIP